MSDSYDVQSIVGSGEQAPSQRVLVVVDGTAIDADVAHLLEDEGIETEVVTGGKKALRRAHAEVPDLLLLPLQLPEMDGAEVIRRIRFDQELHWLRVLLVAPSDQRETADPAGASACLYMPFEPLDLVEAVLKQLQKAAEDQQRRADRDDPSDCLVLVVDDISLFRRVVTRVSRNAGFRVEEAENGEEALTKAQILKPDLIIMDVNMPGMDGLEASRRIRLHPQLYHIPIVILTGNSEGPDVVEALAQGVNDYLVKPLDGEEAIRRMKTLLGLDAA